MKSIGDLRQRVLADSLFPQVGLKAAVDRLGFVQADPIRCPARAQDLILRHRVKNYKVDDLEKLYPRLGLEEEYLYAYGFMKPDIVAPMHPRPALTLSALHRKVLGIVSQLGVAHPKQVESALGSRRVKNVWGGYSQASKKALETLHHHGYLRVAKREKGIRCYAQRQQHPSQESSTIRFQQIVLAAVRAMAVASPRFLLSELSHFRNLIGATATRRKILFALVEQGDLCLESFDGHDFVTLPGRRRQRTDFEDVRFLAPFDPVVRDRKRFELLWGWTYRFEAYTPAYKRVRGYYALPVLWREQIVGWANAKVEGDGLSVELGFVKKRPTEKVFREMAELETSRLANCLGLRPVSWRLSL